MKIKKGDTVKIVAGKDKGKQGKVLKALPKEARVVVEGVNMRAKHIKPKKAEEKGQTVRIPSALSVANVMMVCAQCQKPARVGFRVEGGTKYRVCKKCKGIIRAA